MSLTAHLLLNKPIRLPVGRVDFHSMDKKPVRMVTANQQTNAERQAATRLANIEQVFKAVRAGYTTKLDICVKVKLSEATTLHALHFLMDEGRITRRKVCRHHEYEVVALKEAA